MPSLLEELSALAPEILHERARGARSRIAESEWELGLCLLAAERNQMHRQRGCSSVVQYAVAHLELEAQKASELLRTAHALERLPRLSEAYRLGRLGWGKIRELTRVVTPETEERWLEFASRHSTGEVQRQIALSPREWKQRAQAAGTPRSSTVTATIEVDRSAMVGAQGQGGGYEATAEAGAASGSAHLAEEGRGQGPGPSGAAGSGAVGGSRENPGETTGAMGEGLRQSEGVEAAGGPGTAATGTGVEEPGEPLPLPGPALVRVTLNLTPEQYVLFAQAEQLVRKALRKRARREEVVAEMARRAMATASSRVRIGHQVIVHLDGRDGRAWYETDRGTLPVSTQELEAALAAGRISFAQPGSDDSCGRRGHRSDKPGGESGGAGGESGGGGRPGGAGDPAGDWPGRPREGDSSERTEGEKFSRSKGSRRPLQAATLRALYARAAGRCEVPGCDSRGPLQVHHRRPASRGGGNELGNLEVRCSACHAQVHEADYRDDPAWAGARQRRQARKPSAM